MSPLSLPRTRWLIVCSLVILLLAIAQSPTDEIAVSSFQKAEQLAARGKQEADQTLLSAAEQFFRHTIARRSRDPQPWQSLGDLYLLQGRPADAHAAYVQVIRHDGANTALGRSLAQVYADLGDHRRSARRWTEYLARRPDDRAARRALALVAIRLADWERARVELEHLVANDPGDAVSRAWLGLLLVDPEPAVALPHLQRAAQDPTLAACLEPLFSAQRLSAASEDPAYRPALLGVALLKMGASCLGVQEDDGVVTAEGELGPAATTLALRSLLVATYRNPAYAEAYAYLGQALDRLGWPGWARASFERALDLAPQSPVVLTLTGLYWDRQDESELARHYFQTAYDQDPGNAALCLEIAATFAAEGEYTAAEMWLLLATELAPQDPQVWQTLAHFYLDYGIGVQDVGTRAVVRYLELAPDDARAHDLMGWAHFLAHNDAQAETSLRQALALDASLASAHYHLGRLRARQGRYAEAAKAYRAAERYGLQGHWALELDRAWDNVPEIYRRQP